jgi:MFS family permease
MTTVTLARPTAAASVVALFAINGLQIGGIGGTLPAMRERLDIDAGGLSMLLLCFAAPAVVSMQLGGRLSDSLGARKVALAATPIMVAGIALLAVSQSLPLAIVAMVIGGIGNGAMDVSMNAIGVQVEQARPRPVMSRFHACWSIGNLVGAGVVVSVARLFDLTGASVVPVALLTLAAMGAVWYAVTIPMVPATRTIEHLDSDGVRRKLPAMAWLLGGMGFCFGISEGTAIDWSSVHVTDVAGVDASTGALGLVAVSAFMVLIRLLGDRAVSLFGRRNVVRFGGTTALIGYLLTITTDQLPLLLIGWSLVGLGMGMVAPQVYAVAGHTGGGRMLAVVVTFGYAAFLIGPVVIGGLVGLIGVQYTMILPAILAATLIVISRILPSRTSSAEQ